MTDMKPTTETEKIEFAKTILSKWYTPEEIEKILKIRAEKKAKKDTKTSK